jgi:hypothetical protein
VQYKMTEEFASAMVTVIPVILLLAALEYSSLRKADDQAEEKEVEELSERLRAARNGIDPPLSDAPRMRPPNWWLSFFWYVLAATHVAAEMLLIDWLAQGAREPEPLTAQFIVWVARFGFFGVLLHPVVRHSYAVRARRRRLEAMRAEIAAEIARQQAAA